MPLLDLSLFTITPDPSQPRAAIPEAEIHQLAASITAKGLLLPIRVRKSADKAERFMIVSGHRRFAAMQLLGKTTISCIVVDGELSEIEVFEEQLVENLQRSDLSPLDEAVAYKRYLDLKQCTASVAAKALSISNARISRALKLLELPESIRDAVHSGKISADAAYYLGRLPDGSERTALLERAIRGELHRDEAIRAAHKAKPESKPNPQSKPSPALGRVSFCLSDETRVSVSGTGIDSVDTLIRHVEFLLRAAKKARTQGWDVSTFAKVLRDQTRKNEKADNDSPATTTTKGGVA